MTSNNLKQSQYPRMNMINLLADFYTVKQTKLKTYHEKIAAVTRLSTLVEQFFRIIVLSKNNKNQPNIDSVIIERVFVENAISVIETRYHGHYPKEISKEVIKFTKDHCYNKFQCKVTKDEIESLKYCHKDPELWNIMIANSTTNSFQQPYQIEKQMKKLDIDPFSQKDREKLKILLDKRHVLTHTINHPELDHVKEYFKTVERIFYRVLRQVNNIYSGFDEHSLHGYALNEAKLYKKSIKYLLKTNQSACSDGFVFQSLGEAYAENHSLQNIVQARKYSILAKDKARCINLPPELKDIYYEMDICNLHLYLGRTFNRTGDRILSLECLDMAFAHCDNCFSIYADIVIELDKMKEYRRAQACYEKMLEIYPSDHVSMKKLIVVRKLAGDTDE